MEEKRIFGEFVKENKGKFIKGTVIVLGITAGVILVIKSVKSGVARADNEALEMLGQIGDGLAEGVETIVDATTNV